MKNKPANIILIVLAFASAIFLAPLAIQAADSNNNDKLQSSLDYLKDLARQGPPAEVVGANGRWKWTVDRNAYITKTVEALYKQYPNDPRRWEAVLIMLQNPPTYYEPKSLMWYSGANDNWHSKAVALVKKLKTDPDVPRQTQMDFDGWLLDTAISYLSIKQQITTPPAGDPTFTSLADDYRDKYALPGDLKKFLARWPDHDAAAIFQNYLDFAAYKKDIDARKAVLKEFQGTPNTSVSSYIKAQSSQVDKSANLGNITFTAVDGREVSLEKLRGKVVLFYVWSVRSVLDRWRNDFFLDTYKKYHGKGLEIIGVSMDTPESKDWLLSYIKASKMPWPVSHEGKARLQNPVINALGLNEAGTAPTMLLVDKNGKASFWAYGSGVEAEIKRLLSQK